MPLTLVGLVANFIPYFLIFVPIEESGICWLYYLTRSPYQLERIETWLYVSSEVVKYIINIIELVVLIYYLLYKVSLMTNEKIEIAYESKLIILFWFFCSLINMIIQLVSSAVTIDDIKTERIMAIVAFLFIYLRNISIALIILYFSVINNRIRKNTNQMAKDDAQGENLGMHAIDDFDTAMKSSLPVQYFHEFLKKWNDESVGEEGQAFKHSKKYFEIFQLITIYNLMQNKLNHKQERYETKLKNFKKKNS